MKWWQAESCGLLFARTDGKRITIEVATGPYQRGWRALKHNFCGAATVLGAIASGAHTSGCACNQGNGTNYHAAAMHA